VPIPATGDLVGVASSSPAGSGHPSTFAWDAARDVVASTESLILRATPFCQRRNVGAAD
jgi:hypothetical protein